MAQALCVRPYLTWEAMAHAVLLVCAQEAIPGHGRRAEGEAGVRPRPRLMARGVGRGAGRRVGRGVGRGVGWHTGRGVGVGSGRGIVCGPDGWG